MHPGDVVPGVVGARGGNGGIDTARHGRKNSHAGKPIRRY
jgi:hypothetical protein